MIDTNNCKYILTWILLYTVLELTFYIVLFPYKIEACNPIQLVLFVPELHHRRLNSKEFMSYIKIYAIMHKRLKLRFGILKSIFQRMLFMSVSTFSLVFSLFNIRRQKHESIGSLDPKQLPQNSETPIMFWNI